MLIAGLYDFDAASGGRSPTRAASKSSRRSRDRRDDLLAEVSLVRRAPVKARMRPLRIVKRQVAPNRPARLRDALVGAQIDLLVFHAAPQPFDEHIVAPRSLAVHADGDGVRRQHADEV